MSVCINYKSVKEKQKAKQLSQCLALVPEHVKNEGGAEKSTSIFFVTLFTQSLRKIHCSFYKFINLTYSYAPTTSSIVIGDCISQDRGICTRDLRSFEIRFDFESNFRFGIRFVVMIRFEIFESCASSIVLCKETIGGG